MTYISKGFCLLMTNMTPMMSYDTYHSFMTPNIALWDAGKVLLRRDYKATSPHPTQGFESNAFRVAISLVVAQKKNFPLPFALAVAQQKFFPVAIALAVALV